MEWKRNEELPWGGAQEQVCLNNSGSVSITRLETWDT